MLEKKLHVHIEIALHSSTCEEEFLHSIAYMVKHFACCEDAKRLQKLIAEKDPEYRFIGKSTKIIPSVNTDKDGNSEKI
jgi:hypothetical protein